MTSSSDTVTYSLVLSLVIAAAVLGIVFVPAQTTQIVGFCSLIAVSLLGLLQGTKAAAKVAVAATKVEEVAKEAKGANHNILELTAVAQDSHRLAEATHTLVNSNMGVQLQLNAAALGRIADMTGNEDDKRLAKDAADRYATHQSQQAVVDSGVPTPTALQKAIAPVATPPLSGAAVEESVKSAITEVMQAGNMEVTAEIVNVKKSKDKNP